MARHDGLKPDDQPHLSLDEFPRLMFVRYGDHGSWHNPTGPLDGRFAGVTVAESSYVRHGLHSTIRVMLFCGLLGQWLGVKLVRVTPPFLAGLRFLDV